jgi:IclR family transcriptional regulator, KDG regulon repressor
MKALVKTLKVLETFLKSNKDEISLSELTKLSGLGKPTVSRIVLTLIKLGYLNQSEKRGKYTLGINLIYLGNLVRHKIKIREIAMPHLQALVNSVNELAILTNWDGKNKYLVAEIQASNSLGILNVRDINPPLHCTANGKIFLASMSEQEFDNYINNVKMAAYTDNTITDPNVLRSHLILVAKEGIAYSDEEAELGVKSVCAGIKQADGKVVSSVSIIAPAIRLPRTKMTEIAPKVKACAMEISKVLGYTGL